jgi:hypothetical protein
VRVTPYEDFYPDSPAYRELVSLRIPGGWTVGINKLRVGMDADLTEVGGSSQFYASNPGRRFDIDVEFTPEFDPEGVFVMSVGYQPWPRSPNGRRRKDVPFAFDGHAELVHRFETRSFPELIRELEHWIARCTVWVREPN